jgi:hypothetical protein
MEIIVKKMPTPAVLFGAIAFGSLGMGAFLWGKRTGSLKAIVIGLLLMVFPYFVPGTLAVYGIGAGLTAALFLFRD